MWGRRLSKPRNGEKPGCRHIALLQARRGRQGRHLESAARCGANLEEAQRAGIANPSRLRAHLHRWSEGRGQAGAQATDTATRGHRRLNSNYTPTDGGLRFSASASSEGSVLNTLPKYCALSGPPRGGESGWTAERLKVGGVFTIADENHNPAVQTRTGQKRRSVPVSRSFGVFAYHQPNIRRVARRGRRVNWVWFAPLDGFSQTSRPHTCSFHRGRQLAT